MYICVQFAESSRSFAKYISISFGAINGLISLVSKETVVPRVGVEVEQKIRVKQVE